MKILALEAYWGESHAYFLDVLIKYSRHSWTVLKQPDCHWKWRMQSAPYFFSQKLTDLNQKFDALFGSSMLDLPLLRGLYPASAQIPALLYFHENQLSYPLPPQKTRDYSYAFKQILSALNAEAVLFNSQFHQKEFLIEAEKWLARMPGPSWKKEIARIRQKSALCYPGIEVSKISPSRPKAEKPLRLLWSARWEWEKGKDLFCSLIEALLKKDFSFKLALCGFKQHQIDTKLKKLKTKLGDRIYSWGWLKNREDYCALLDWADCYISTARQEFFGLGAVEAAARGTIPLLPGRLAYPEIFTQEKNPDFFYINIDDLEKKIIKLNSKNLEKYKEEAIKAASVYRAEKTASEIDNWLEKIKL